MPKLIVPERYGESQAGKEIVEEANRRLREGGLTRQDGPAKQGDSNKKS